MWVFLKGWTVQKPPLGTGPVCKYGLLRIWENFRSRFYSSELLFCLCEPLDRPGAGDLVRKRNFQPWLFSDIFYSPFCFLGSFHPYSGGNTQSEMRSLPWKDGLAGVWRIPWGTASETAACVLKSRGSKNLFHLVCFRRYLVPLPSPSMTSPEHLMAASLLKCPYSGL
jgi:hypothetical protein